VRTAVAATKDMRVIVIGGSSGGLEALKALLRDLDPDLPVSILVVLHTGAESPAMTADILSNHTGWPCDLAQDGDRIRAGRVVLARPDHHLLVKPGRISTPRGPKENGFRPAIDLLFRTAAKAYRDRVIGIILSGSLDDGAQGLMLVKQYGGITIVQDPGEALTPSMPSNAIRATAPHHVVPVSHMAAILTRLGTEPGAQGVGTLFEDEKNDIAERGEEALVAGSVSGLPSRRTCTDCGGTLWELEEGEIPRCRCHVGHAFNGKALLNRTVEVETALWTALRTLEETAALRRRMAEKANGGRLPGLAAGYERSSEELERRADIIRNVLVSEGLQVEAIQQESIPVSTPQKRQHFPARRR
jgi:two-component system, chemotaxis family, protein-glutamate methylesterase/glutaminase